MLHKVKLLHQGASTPRMYMYILMLVVVVTSTTSYDILY